MMQDEHSLTQAGLEGTAVSKTRARYPIAGTLATAIRERWQSGYARVLTAFYFDRISHIGQHLPQHGPILFVGTHRNGIVDALVYSKVLGPMTFVLARRLLETAPGRFFFGGFGVTRKKDGQDRHHNNQTLTACSDFVSDGGRLFMFPEGTSGLGRRLLPMKHGAARIASQALRRNQEVQIVPVTVHYEKPEGFRSRAAVNVGRPIKTSDLSSLDDETFEKRLHLRIESALKSQAGEWDTDDELEAARALRSVATLTAMEASKDKGNSATLSHEFLQSWQDLKAVAEKHQAETFAGLPIIEEKVSKEPRFRMLASAPFVLMALAFFGPGLLAGRWAGKRLADARHTVSLMRLLIGAPVMAVWLGATAAVASWLGAISLWLLLLGFSLIGLTAWRPLAGARVVLRNRKHRKWLIDPTRRFLKAANATSHHQ